MTAHPLFATLVSLWFAVTFALSILAVSGAMIERMVLAAQLDLILPMAAPPLGTTARLLLALGFGLIGAGIGRLVVWLLVREGDEQEAAQVSPMPYRKASADLPPRTPIRAHAELGPQGFDHLFTDPPTLAPTFAPPPAPVAEAAPVDVPVEQPPVETSSVAQPAPMAPQPEARATRPVGFPTPPSDGPSAAEKIAHAALDNLNHVELIERLAIAMQRHRETDDGPISPDQAPEAALPHPLRASAPDGTGMALRTALANLREVK